MVHAGAFHPSSLQLDLLGDASNAGRLDGLQRKLSFWHTEGVTLEQ